MTSSESVDVSSRCPSCGMDLVWRGVRAAVGDGTSYRIDCPACTETDTPPAAAPEPADTTATPPSWWDWSTLAYTLATQLTRRGRRTAA